VISESILVGEKVRLRPVQESDLPAFVEWLADSEVTRFLTELDAPTLEEEREWYERRRADPDGVNWAIETSEGRLLGSVELRVVPARRKAELGIGIFDKTQWNQGFGTETVRLVLAFGFEELELNRIELTTA
jgi:RimJ/RimL family protein N-acetyltransferase